MSDTTSTTADAAATAADASTTETQDTATTSTTTDAETATWDQVFEGEDPAKVRKALDHARVWEKRAKDNSAAADRLAELEPEVEKLTGRIAELEPIVAAVPTQVTDQLRTHLVALHEIPEDDAALYLTATDPETLLKQAAGLVDKSGKRTGPRVRREGETSSKPTDPKREFIQGLTAGAD